MVHARTTAEIAASTAEDIERSVWDRVGMQQLQFDQGRATIDPVTERRERIYDDDGSRLRQVQVLTVFVPYTGTMALWQLVPTQAFNDVRKNRVGLRKVDVLDQRTLTIEFYVSDKDENAIKAEIERTYTRLGQLVKWCNEEVETWTRETRAAIADAIKARKGVADRADSLTSALGIPIRQRPFDQQIPIPVTKKQLRMSQAPAEPKPDLPPEYVLQDSVYDQIVQTIDGTTKAMERTSTATVLSVLTEPGLRDLLLIVLNANYEGGIAGEVFNGDGKTDILLHWEGGVPFIGECKFWTGPQSLTGATDQLLSYVTWRDTRAALVIFIKDRRDITAVIAEAARTLQNHPNYVRVDGDRSGSETRSHHVLRSLTDAEREVKVALICVPLHPEKPGRTSRKSTPD